MTKTFKKLICLILVFCFTLTSMGSVFAINTGKSISGLEEGQLNDLIKNSKLSDVEIVNDNTKISKVTDKDNNEKFILTYKEHNEKAPKNLPKQTVNENIKIDISDRIEEQKSPSEDDILLDRAYFAFYDSLEEAEEVANIIKDGRDPQNSDISINALGSRGYFGNSSYAERSYSSSEGYYYHIHLSSNDASHLKESLQNWVLVYWGVMAIITAIGGTPAGVAASAACVIIGGIANQLIVSSYYSVINSDNTVDIYIYDNDINWIYDKVGYMISGKTIGYVLVKGAWYYIRWYGYRIHFDENSAWE